MAVRVPQIYKGMYLGNMETNKADLLMQIREMKSMESLKKMVFNFPPELVLRSVDEQKSIRSILKEEDTDYTQYIGELRDYQTTGTAFMYINNRSIIGDGVGLGKTAEIAALINYLKHKGEITRFLLAVETSALGQSVCELMKFTGLYVVQLPSEADKMRRAIEKIDWNNVDGIVIKHSALRSDTLSKWLALNIKEDGTCRIFNTFLLDESSVIKNINTKISMYTKNICDITPRVHFLNATTFETSIMDIYNQVDMLDWSVLPSKSAIEKQYCTFTMGKYWSKKNGVAKLNWRRDLSGYKNEQEFKDRLKTVYFGRCKKDIGMDKPHIYKVYEIEPTNEQSMALAKGYRYAEVLNCPSLIKDICIPTKRETVPKIDRLVNLVENELHGDSVMVYCFHNEAQRAIKEEMLKIGRKPVVLSGESTDEERWAIQSGFNNGEYDVIITNIQKSLNLYGGDACIFYSNSGNVARMEQIRGRIDRNVDDKTKTFILLLYRGTDEQAFFMNKVKQRAKDSRSLTIDAKGAVDYFMDSLSEQE